MRLLRVEERSSHVRLLVRFDRVSISFSGVGSRERVAKRAKNDGAQAEKRKRLVRLVARVGGRERKRKKVETGVEVEE